MGSPEERIPFLAHRHVDWVKTQPFDAGGGRGVKENGLKRFRVCHGLSIRQ
jgi:hypothetical protein